MDELNQSGLVLVVGLGIRESLEDRLFARSKVSDNNINKMNNIRANHELDTSQDRVVVELLDEIQPERIHLSDNSRVFRVFFGCETKGMKLFMIGIFLFAAVTLPAADIIERALVIGILVGPGDTTKMS